MRRLADRFMAYIEDDEVFEGLIIKIEMGTLAFGLVALFCLWVAA